MNTLYPPTTVGGAERSVAVLAEALASAGDEVHVIALDDCKDASSKPDNGVTVHRLPHGNLSWPFGDDRSGPVRRVRWHFNDRGTAPVTKAVGALLRRIAPDVLHTNNLTGFGSGVIPMACAMDIPIVHTLRDFSLLCPRASLFRSGKDCETRCGGCRLLTGPRMTAAEEVQVVIGNSDYMVNRHRDEGLFKRTAARTIYNAVPNITGSAKVAPRDAARPFHIGFLGAVKPEKGVEYLLDACRALPDSGWTLTIAGKGDGAYVDRLKHQYADLPVSWPGFVPAGQFYGDTDLVVIPSVWPEPMPRILIEAMANGLPVLVSDAGGAPEVARLYSGATIYPRRDTAALGRLLARAVRDRPSRVSTDADIIERFGTARLVAEYRDAYRAAIAQAANG